MTSPVKADQVELTVFPRDGELFELFVEAMLKELGFRILVRPARGPDGGRDLIVEQILRDGLGTDRTERILVQCKHYAHGGRAVSTVGDFREALIRNSCHRYLLVTSTTVTENLRRTFEAFNQNARFPGERADYWTGTDVMKAVKENPHLYELFFQSAPITYRQALPADQTIDALLESHAYGTVLLNTQGVIVSANEHFEQLFPSAHEGQHCWERYHHFSRNAGSCSCCTAVEAFRRNEEVEAMAWSPIGPKGALRWVHIRSVPMHDTRGELAGAVEVVHDIHDKMALDAMRRSLCAAKGPAEILSTALLGMAQFFGFERCAVFQLADDGKLTGVAALSLDKSAIREQQDRAGIAFTCDAEESAEPPELPSIHCPCTLPDISSAKRILPALPEPDSSDFAIIEVVPTDSDSDSNHPFLESLDHWVAICFAPEHPWQVLFVFGNNVPFPTTHTLAREFLQRIAELTSLALLRLEVSDQPTECECLDAPNGEDAP